MIKGDKKIELTRENILKYVTAYDIFKYYMPNRWKVNEAAFSPFRDERNPSFIIGNRSGNLTFIDFSDTSLKGDCFTFVKLMLNLSNLDEVLKNIDKDLNINILGKSGNFISSKPIIKQPQPEDDGKRYALVQASTRAFTKEELAYWNEYHQDISDLKKEHIYSISKVYLNRKLFTLKDTDLRFGYYYDGCWKIYRPFADKRIKWMPNNVPITTMDGKKNIIGADNAMITKSKKDYMVLKKVYPTTCAVQNEGPACFSKENVEYLKTNSKKQILSFDSDTIGVTNSIKVTEMFDFDYCNVPKIYLGEGINDWALLGRNYGLNKVEECLKQKGIII